MSGYLALAKKARTEVRNSLEAPPTKQARRPEEAKRLGCVARWSRYPTWIEIHDPVRGEWHEVKASECLPGVVAEADRWRKGGAA